MGGYTQTLEVYGCADCSGCEHKAKCLYKYNSEKDADKNKVMKINERWKELKEHSHENIQSEKGILNRQIRSLQTEGHFGDIKKFEGKKEEFLYPLPSMLSSAICPSVHSLPACFGLIIFPNFDQIFPIPAHILLHLFGVPTRHQNLQDLHNITLQIFPGLFLLFAAFHVQNSENAGLL